jgi:hypothetical protein
MTQLYENRLYSLLFIENVVTLIKNVDLNLDYNLLPPRLRVAASAEQGWGRGK